jgi:hypothetical protein
MVKPHLTDRIKITSLPSDISTFLRSKYRRPAENKDTFQEPERKERGKCGLCGRTKDDSATVKRSSCQQFACKQLVQVTYTCEAYSDGGEPAP